MWLHVCLYGCKRNIERLNIQIPNENVYESAKGQMLWSYDHRTSRTRARRADSTARLLLFFRSGGGGRGVGVGGEYLTLEGLSRKVKILFDNRVHRAGQNGYFSHDFNMVKIHQKTKIS